MAYFQDIKTGIRTTVKGLKLTLQHIRNATKRRTPEGIASDNYFDLQNGLVTLQYPHEQLPIPDNGRYRLRNEIDDCIVCDKCAKICPVDCITIDPIKATEEVGRASDGSPIRLYAATFDIDMAKCCYCGLCTVVCPTECLTMDKKFDYSEFELDKLTYHFSNLTHEQADEKRALYEQYVREKEEAKAAQITAKAASTDAAKPTSAPARPVFRPTAKPIAKTPSVETPSPANIPLEQPSIDDQKNVTEVPTPPKRPIFRPTQKPVSAEKAELPTEPKQDTTQSESTETKSAAKPPGFRPTMKPPVSKPEVATTESEKNVPDAPSSHPQEAKSEPVKPAFRPTMKPAAKTADATSEETSKPAFRPTMKPKPSVDTLKSLEEEKPKPAFRPTMKPVAKDVPVENVTPASATSETNESVDEPVAASPKPKPAFRPTMRPKPKSDDEQSA